MSNSRSTTTDRASFDGQITNAIEIGACDCLATAAHSVAELGLCVTGRGALTVTARNAMRIIMIGIAVGETFAGWPGTGLNWLKQAHGQVAHRAPGITSRPVTAPAEPVTTTRPATHVYKKVDECELRADVYEPNGEGSKPTIVWIHGGALIMGSRADVDRRQLARYLRAGYNVVTFDYRLAPETKLDDITKDVRDALNWVKKRGPTLFHADPARIAVIGHSAGGYLSLMTGCCIDPHVKAVVSFYGYGDIAGGWLTHPSYITQPLVPERRARRAVGRTCATDSPKGRLAFYVFCRQNGVWTREVSGMDPLQSAEALSPFCPLRNVTNKFPPTLLLHGDKDEDVPYQQSVLMAEAFDKAGVEHRLITIPAGPHGFDSAMNSPAIAAAFDQVLTFLEKHLRR